MFLAIRKFSAILIITLVFPFVASASTKPSTAAARSTYPDLSYHGQTLISQVKYFDRLQRDYEKDLAKWYKEKEKYEQKIAAERRKREEQERKLALNAMKSSAFRGRSSADGDASLATNPLSWFQKRIGRIENKNQVNENRHPKIEFNKTSRGKLTDDENMAENIDNPNPKKKESFWKRILIALGIA